MASYYYLISSLPMLDAGGELPFSYAEFLSMCASAVEEEEYEVLKGLTAASESGPLVEEWAKFYGALANELTYQRNVKLGRACEPPAERDPDAMKTVAAALNAKNPLEAENLLFSLEFEKLDEMTALHYFDDVVLNGYALKLKLLERRRAFEHDAGKTEFTRLLGELQRQLTDI